ncbi:RNA recognition motif domain-containing protein [Paenibacillus hodogayensis]|uniref:RNA recognition motif domain-containing protein n=1 Tax=Paenibacillus hodogayensis TaxID=279208 RepID=A0ABV5W2S3_9BACL
MDRRMILTACGTFIIGALAGVLVMVNDDANGAIKQALSIGTNNAIGGATIQTTSMTATLEFRNLPWAFTIVDLYNAVKPYSEVLSARIATDRESGRSAGYGFVEVPRDKMQTVINALNGAGWGGRNVTVEEATRRTDIPQRAGR